MQAAQAQALRMLQLRQALSGNPAAMQGLLLQQAMQQRAMQNQAQMMQFQKMQAQRQATATLAKQQAVMLAQHNAQQGVEGAGVQGGVDAGTAADSGASQLQLSQLQSTLPEAG